MTTLEQSIGRRLRQSRLERNLTVAEAAAAADLSTGFISLIENGKSDITVGRLSRLLSVLGLDLSFLVGLSDDVDGRDSSSLIYHSQSEGVGYESLCDDVSIKMRPVRVTLEPGGGWKDYSRHPGEEFIFVQDGVIELTLCGEKRVMGPGETATFDSDIEHRLTNPTKVAAVIIAVAVDVGR